MGRVERDSAGRLRLVRTRTFRAPIQDVWSAVTEPDRLARWIGTYTGDPASVRIAFRMTSKGDAPAEEVEIIECNPPRLLSVKTHTGNQQWQLTVALSETNGVTTLTFTHADLDPMEAESIGPGWEYYLDRLVAAETGGDVAAINFDADYYPAMLEHYRA
jgi:uncharacterized protein YndB with AHSA1/START domain